MGTTPSTSHNGNTTSTSKSTSIRTNAITSTGKEKHIGIIGAGPAGLAALKTVLDAPEYKEGLWEPVILEAREDVGGVWCPAPSSFSTPSTSSPSSSLSHSSSALPTPPPTPLYDSLTTNLPHPVMAFSSFGFPPSTSLFPKASVVQTYLGAYADAFQLRKHIEFETRVVGIRWAVEDSSNGKAEGTWEVTTTQARGDAEPLINKHHFDLLLICTGHYAEPNYPSEDAMSGLGTWLAARRAGHSVFYRNPLSLPLHSSYTSTKDLAQATILIVGSGPSGTDIASDLAPVAGRVLMSSSSYTPPTVTPASSSSTRNAKQVVSKPLPTRFHVSEGPSFTPSGKVTFADGTEEDVDFCVLATGYEVDFPFFDQRIASSIPPSSSKSLSSASTPSTSTSMPTSESINHASDRFPLPKPVLPSALNTSSRTLTNSNACVFPLAKHLFPLPGFYPARARAPASSSQPHPTSIAFLGLLVRVAPLPLVEAQARAALGAWAFCLGNTGKTTKELDWAEEENAIEDRWDVLAKRWEELSLSKASELGPQPDDRGSDAQKRAYVAKNWHRLPDAEQFAYRDTLDAFAFSLAAESPSQSRSRSQSQPHKVRPWEPQFYCKKAPLRAAWRALEARGDGSAERWIGGVGEGRTGQTPEEEWVCMMEKLLDWWEGEGKHASDAS